jgi:hypothetical protein
MNAAQREERRAFREAMRRRIRLIAKERNLPDTEIKWMGRLKHYDLSCFSQKHRVDIAWLIAGDLRGLLKTVRAKQQSA